MIMRLSFIQDRIKSYNAKLRDSNVNHDASKKIQKPHGDVRHAAVLIPILSQRDGLTLLLTQRTDHLDNHPGQVSFPGGVTEANDDTLEHTALRETREEIGLKHSNIDILGRIDT